MKTVIHHSADFDGIFCREIAKHFLGTEGVNYIGWDFKDPPIPLPENYDIVVLDLPIDKPFGLNFRDGVVEFQNGNTQPLDRTDWKNVQWIDHHKSAIESHPTDIPGYRIDGVAACRLAWQWFANAGRDIGGAEYRHTPPKQDFIDRKVSEPLAVRLAGEYDIWDHRGDGDLEFQFGLRVEKACGEIQWDWLLDGHPNYVEPIIAQGRLVMRYSADQDASMTRYQAFLVQWEGLKFLALNTGRFNSQTFAALDIPETGHDALMGFNWNGKGWTFSLYHAAHRKDLDLSEIAKRYGGGGHRGACGFTSPTLPIPL